MHFVAMDNFYFIAQLSQKSSDDVAKLPFSIMVI
jgi:hypothetical protein